MNRLAKWMMRMYPARWRARYGEELDALLADTGANAHVVADLAKGGIRMQFSTWSLAKLAVVLGFAGLLLGAGGSYLIDPIYVSKATIKIAPEGAGEEFRQSIPLVLSRTSLAGIINDPKLLLYTNELKVTPLEDVIENMHRDISIEPIGKGGTTAGIAFQYPDAAKARQTTAALVVEFMELARDSQHPLPAVTGPHVLEVVDVPSLPINPYFPRKGLVEWTGCFAGLIAAFAWRRFRKKPLLKWGFAVSAVALGLAGSIAGNVASIWDGDFRKGGVSPVGNIYRSTAVMSIPDPAPGQVQRLISEATSASSLSAIADEPRLRHYRGGSGAEETLRRHLSLTPDSTGHFLTISIEYSGRFAAQATASAVVNRVDKLNQQLYGGPSGAPAVIPWSLTVLEQPSTPVFPIKPNRYLIAGDGCLAGLCASAVIAAIRRRWRPEADIGTV